MKRHWGFRYHLKKENEKKKIRVFLLYLRVFNFASLAKIKIQKGSRLKQNTKVTLATQAKKKRNMFV